MVTYVVVRPELDRILGGKNGGPGHLIPWSMTESLAHRYASQPDPLQQAILRNFHGYKKDTPNSEKSSRLSKSRNSFRFGKNKNSNGSRTSATSGKTVQVKGHSSVEELEKKHVEICRLLDCSEGAVSKKIPAYLVGLPYMVLENVIALTREIDQMSPNANSSELSSLMTRMNQTVAQHALWSDHYYLYGNESHSDQSISAIVQNVKEAVKNLVEFAINKENQNVPDSTFCHSDSSHNESNSSFHSQESPYCPRRKLNESRSKTTHDSMTDLPSSTSGYNSLTRNSTTPPKKLTHSLSSDSILDNKENVKCAPNNPIVYIMDPDGTSSSEDLIAPPIPPKNKKGRSSLGSSYNEFEPSMKQSSLNNSLDGEFARRSSGLMISFSTPNSLSQSLDYSLNHSASNSDSSVHQPPLQCPSRLGGERVGGSNSLGSIDLSPVHTDLTAMLANNCEISHLSCTMSSSSKTYYSQMTVRSCASEDQSTSSSDSFLGEPNAHSRHVSTSHHHLSIDRNSRDSACSLSSRSSGAEIETNAIAMNVPPAIPKKTIINQSHYDNVDSFTTKVKSELLKTHELSPSSYTRSSTSSSGCSELGSSKSSMASFETSASSNSVTYRTHRPYYGALSGGRASLDKPPLPPKQKHIMEYMQIFKDHQIPEKEWFQLQRRSEQIVSSYQSQTVNEFREFESNLRLSLPSASNGHRHSPPALPPKRKSRSPDCHQLNQLRSGSTPQMDRVPSAERSDSWQPPDLCSCRANKEPAPIVHNSVPPPDPPTRAKPRTEVKKEESNESRSQKQSQENLPKFVGEVDSDSLVDSLNVNGHIMFQADTEESDMVKAGSVDALVVYATYSKNGTYLEAFLTTYRTFLTPAELISKLFYRYYKFVCRSSTEYQKAAKNAFSLLVRVVHDLVVIELTEELLEHLAKFDYNLLAKGDLKLALYFRKKLKEKLELRKNHQEQIEFTCHYISIDRGHKHTLLDFKSSDIADQMTLIDSELFAKFGIPELLHYARDQNEENSPNLTLFAKQINDMSSWVKTLILISNSQDREKYYKKFLKIMKHLRKVNNNFNSCLAIVSGLDSTEISRLDWPKASTDMLKEYSILCDFTGSYTAYRQALEDTKPPCIPHLGITLQDLTKLYYINPDDVDGKVNFMKRWLQFKILENMKRFIPSKYDIKKDETIRNFMDNYKDCMSDSGLWDLSFSIKPK